MFPYVSVFFISYFLCQRIMIKKFNLGRSPISGLLVWTVYSPLVSSEQEKLPYSQLHFSLLQHITGKCWSGCGGKMKNEHKEGKKGKGRRRKLHKNGIKHLLNASCLIKFQQKNGIPSPSRRIIHPLSRDRFAWLQKRGKRKHKSGYVLWRENRLEKSSIKNELN